MTVAESTVGAVDIEFASNFAASGSPFTASAFTVPAGSSITLVDGNNSFSTSDISSVAIGETGSHTWTILTPTYSDTAFPLVVAYWHNSTGSSVNITPTITNTYTNNRTTGFSAHLIAGDDGSPSLRTTVTTGISTQSAISASAVPTTIGSLMCIHYVHQEATAAASSFVAGTTGDTSPAGFGLAGTGSNSMGLGTLYQTATNSQTSSTVTVGAAAPTDGYLFAALVEYKPAGGSTPKPIPLSIVKAVALKRASTW